MTQSYLARQRYFVVLAMSDSHQEVLRKAWTEGRAGTLSALSEAKAWALREVWRSEGNSDWGLMNFVAERVEKIVGGNPQQPANSKFFACKSG